jgi:hypothetical protein
MVAKTSPHSVHGMCKNKDAWWSPRTRDLPMRTSPCSKDYQPGNAPVQSTRRAVSRRGHSMTRQRGNLHRLMSAPGRMRGPEREACLNCGTFTFPMIHVA